MEGLFFLGGLFAIGWLAYWVTQEGREAPPGKQKWSPFDWRDDTAPPTDVTTPPRTRTSWRDRRR
ncbi:MAG: hypothetical protein PHT60_05970 [Acidiphilium sp.]|nr:hypothetical protein [Acidiphilium sp.]